MATNLLVILSIILTIQSSQIKGDEATNEDLSNFAEMAAELFQSQGAQGLGSVVQGLMSNALSGALSGEIGGESRATSNLDQLLRGIGNMVGPNAQGIDTDVISGIVGMIGNSLDPEKKDKKNKDGVDLLSMISTVTGVLSQPGSAEKLEQITAFMPLVMDMVNSLYGPQAKEREKRHAGHSWLFPPLLEKIHLLADHFLNSDIGRKVLELIGAEKVIKIFSDENGKFSYDKFVELMENHSFRRHWIHMLVLRIGKFFEQYSNPKLYEEYLNMGVQMLNGYLLKQGYPKTVMINMKTPVESLSSLVNFITRKYLGTKIDSKYYIQPVYSYTVQILGMVRQASSRGGTEGISAKLADSINLEIIEPIARVNRAYRYLKKNPKCDRYVLCLVNQRGPETDSLPGLKLLLSRGTSLVASWALSSDESVSIMEYFNIIMYEDQCQKFFKADCSDYHEEEVKVTTEYIHNEL